MLTVELVSTSLCLNIMKALVILVFTLKLNFHLQSQHMSQKAVLRRSRNIFENTQMCKKKAAPAEEVTPQKLYRAVKVELALLQVCCCFYKIRITLKVI